MRVFGGTLFFCAVAVKHDSRDIKIYIINLKINLAFLDRGCRVLRLPQAFSTSFYSRGITRQRSKNAFKKFYIAAVVFHGYLVAGSHYLEPISRLPWLLHTVEISLPRRRDIPAIIRSR